MSVADSYKHSEVAHVDFKIKVLVKNIICA